MNEILEEIRRIRDEHARECGYDLNVIVQNLREETEALKAQGWKVVDLSSSNSAARTDES
jgi:hypothetical protein